MATESIASIKADIVSDVAAASSNASGLISGTAGLVAGKGATKVAEFDSNGSIKQSERLFTARPRYAPKASSQDDVYSKSTASRGTHAFIRLMTSSEQKSKYLGGKGAREDADLTGEGSLVASMVNDSTTSGYDQFVLTGVSCTFQEKLQVTEVFGDGEVAYYFGRQPIMFQISGVLIDSPDNSWFTDWLRMYNSVLRGTQLAKNYELLKLVLPNMVLTGSIAATSWTQGSDNDVSIGFTMQFLAKRIDPTAPATYDINATDAKNLIDFGKYASFVSQQGLNLKKTLLGTTGAKLSELLSSPNTTVSALGQALTSFTEGVKGFVSPIAGTLDSINSAVKDFVNGNEFSKNLASTASLFRTLSANLNGIRTQLFSPIYGVLTSLTRLVQNTAGNISSIFSSIFSPIRNVLKDITNIANQAVGLVNLVNSSIRGIGRSLKGEIGSTIAQFNTAMKSVGKAAGSIATSPKTALQSVREMFSGGALSASAAFLQDNRKASLSGSASMLGGGGSSNYKSAILLGQPAYSAKAGAAL